MLMIPTSEQEAAISAASSLSSLMLSAYAGTAKTTTLQLMAPQIKIPALALAFNKKIATELQTKLPGNFSAKTLNGLGHGAWIRANPQVTKWTLDDRKIGKLTSQIAEASGIKLLNHQWDVVRGLVNQAMIAGLVPASSGPEGLVPDTLEAWTNLVTELDLSEAESIIELAREILIESIKQARQGIICFNDQIYCPTLFGGQWPKFPAIFIDESQDLSPLNHRMLTLVSRPGTKFVSVGDRRQAIYAWRGADANSMDTMRSLSPQWQDLPLTLTFRCPKIIVARQQDHAPGYRAAESNPEGQFYQLLEWGPKDITRLLSQSEGKPLAILCRNMAPLMGLAFKLLRAGIGCQVAGRDLARGLKGLVTKLAPAEAPITKLMANLETWENHETSLALANHQEHKIESIEDRAEAIRAVAESTSVTQVRDLLQLLDQLFSRDSGRVWLSTIHRAKGLEWPVVVHLDPWRIPSKWARRSQDPVQLDQEANLRYVAETRTRKVLVEAKMEGWEAN